MLGYGPTTPQDYPKWSGFGRQRERERVTGGSGRRSIRRTHPRIYIIGNDGITLCRDAPATASEWRDCRRFAGGIACRPLRGKRLLALWNAVPGIKKGRKVGGRDELIDQLWSAI